MGGTGPWVRGMATWHHPLFTGPDRYMVLDPYRAWEKIYRAHYNSYNLSTRIH